MPQADIDFHVRMRCLSPATAARMDAMTSQEHCVSVLFLEGLCRELRARVDAQTRPQPKSPPHPKTLRRLLSQATLLMTLLLGVAVTVAQQQAIL